MFINLQDFYDRDGNLDYEKLLIALNNQAYRRRWIKLYLGYLFEWANYMASSGVYKR